MSSFKINFLKLLRSTAMTLLFIPGVSAMEDDWEDYSQLLAPSNPTMSDEGSSSSSGGRASPSSSSYPSTPSSIGFLQTSEEEMATEVRSSQNLGEPQKLFLLNNDHRFIKGEVPGDGTCFLHTLNMLFPDRGISRDEFTIRLSAAFLGGNASVSSEELRQELLGMLFPGKETSKARDEFATRLSAALARGNTSVPSEELRREFAAELYAQLYQLKLEGVALEFKEGANIKRLSDYLLNDTPGNYFDDRENIEYIKQSISNNDQIIKEMLVAYAQTYTMLSLPASKSRKKSGKKLGNVGSFGLACKLFNLNLDIYAPIGETNYLDRWANFSFGGASLPQAALFASAHVSPLCLEADLETRRRFAENEIRVILQEPEISSSVVSDSALQSDLLSFLIESSSLTSTPSSSSSTPSSSSSTPSSSSSAPSSSSSAPSSSTPAPSSSSSTPSSSTPAPSSSTPAVKSALELDTREFHMGKRNNYPSSGFSAFENTHRWTEGKHATITISLAEMGFPSRISFLNTGGFVTSSHRQDLTVKMNGEEVRRYVYTITSNNHTIDINLPKDGLLATIDFEIPTAISPSDLGIGADKRELGISFKEVKFQY